VAGFVKANELFGSADKVLLAVSGGADSTALLHAMYALKAEGAFRAELICAHINHQLRGSQAELDEDFVITQATELNLSITTRRLDVRGFAHKNKLSIETAARKLRIESLLDIAKLNNCNRIATGHQKNDNAETIIQRLIRGTGLRGLGGIWPVRKLAGNINLVRPLLCVRRDEIVEYLKKRNLKWRVDKTNDDCRYRRNYIRHRLIPALQQECSDSVVEQLFDLSQSAQRFYSLVCSCAEKAWPELANCASERVALDSKKFLIQPQPVKVEIVRRSLATIGSGERDLTQGHFKSILQLAEQNVSGRKIILPDGFVVWREYGNLIFARPKMSEVRNQMSEIRNLSSVLCPLSSVVLEIPGQTRFGQYLIEATVLDAGCSMLDAHRRRKSRIENRESRIELIEWFDLDKMQLPLAARFREVGDRFWPLGLAGEKKVGKFLTAAKVPQQIRKKLLIVADSEKIIWVWPIRISEQAKITAKTGKILQLQITDASPAH